jgi:hypothetical protein
MKYFIKEGEKIPKGKWYCICCYLDIQQSTGGDDDYAFLGDSYCYDTKWQLKRDLIRSYLSWGKDSWIAILKETIYTLRA